MITTQRAELHELDPGQMAAIRQGLAAGVPGTEDYPPEGSLIGFRIRVERSERGEVAGPWWQIVRRSDGLAVGDINLHDVPDPEGEVVIGMSLVPSAQGRGLGTEVLRATCEWALAQPNISAVRAEIDEGNPASRRMAEKAGMRFVGMLGGDRQYVIP